MNLFEGLADFGKALDLDFQMSLFELALKEMPEGVRSYIQAHPDDFKTAIDLAAHTEDPQRRASFMHKLTAAIVWHVWGPLAHAAQASLAAKRGTGT